VLSKTTLHPSYTTRSLDSPPPAHHPYYYYLPMNDELAVKIRAGLEAELAWNAELRKSMGLEEINHDDSQEVVDAKVLERAEVLEEVCDVKCDGKCDVEAIVAHILRLQLANVKEEKERKRKEKAEEHLYTVIKLATEDAEDFCSALSAEDPIAMDPTTIGPITHNGYSQAHKLHSPAYRGEHLEPGSNLQEGYGRPPIATGRIVIAVVYLVIVAILWNFFWPTYRIWPAYRCGRGWPFVRYVRSVLRSITRSNSHACGNCGAADAKTKCPRCKRARYCGEECRQQALRSGRHNKVECSRMRAAGPA
jgi:hypothetical protein